MEEIPQVLFPIFSKHQLPDSTKDLSSGAVFLLDKPSSWSSFRLVKKLRWLIQVKKVGHAGTLDPMATGLMICCVGKATKSVDSFQAQHKTYEAKITFGASTPSYDAETPVDTQAPWEHLTEPLIHETLENSFNGLIEQVPPMFSALKVDGQRLYKLAHKGQEIERKSRQITIFSTQILRFDPPELEISIKCSKGTYIRSIAHDLGLALGSRAYLSALKRTQIGEFSLKNALTIEELESCYDRT